MFKPDFTKSDDPQPSYFIPEGVHIVTLIDIEEVEKGFKFVLSLGKDFFPCEHMFWTHTREDKYVTNYTICDFYQDLDISTDADVSALIGKEFEARFERDGNRTKVWIISAYNPDLFCLD